MVGIFILISDVVFSGWAATLAGVLTAAVVSGRLVRHPAVAPRTVRLQATLVRVGNDRD